MKHIYFTVTNDLSYDQRMQRICGTLAGQGYQVTLVGRKLTNSIPLQQRPFQQKRLHCLFQKGPLFYIEYNVRLFLFLSTQKIDAICAIDLDTILPCLYTSVFKRIPRVYDAHEYFTELKEVRTRPIIRQVWSAIERFAVPRFKAGYTVSEGLAELFKKHYGKEFQVIRNVPVCRALNSVTHSEKYLFYQGAVNEARGFEYLIPAMVSIPYKLVICGDGNFMPQLKKLIEDYQLENRIELRGMLTPDELWPLAQAATLGLGLAEEEGLNQYLALPNKFFDYIQAGLPQITMDYPEYRKINKQYEVAVLIHTLEPVQIAGMITELLADDTKLARLKSNCLMAREVLNWQQEEKKLIHFYKEALHD